MAQRVQFNAWGRGLDRIDLPAYALQQDGETKIEAVCRAIAGKNRPIRCATVRQDGTALEGGKPVATHYQITLGIPVKTGGYNVKGEIWVSVPRDAF